uniref:Uncharacterized protein n=1 Tax=Anguilla anguilla TaxID=7936 RepID=A0A0E9PQ62_ANGAN
MKAIFFVNTQLSFDKAIACHTDQSDEYLEMYATKRLFFSINHMEHQEDILCLVSFFFIAHSMFIISLLCADRRDMTRGQLS